MQSETGSGTGSPAHTVEPASVDHTPSGPPSTQDPGSRGSKGSEHPHVNPYQAVWQQLPHHKGGPVQVSITDSQPAPKKPRGKALKAPLRMGEVQRFLNISEHAETLREEVDALRQELDDARGQCEEVRAAFWDRAMYTCHCAVANHCAGQS